ncbi:MAG: hypothetical protein HKO92_11665 [Flavobacteriaceae bacterium]|nr:hypothetical protein [Flavobacteriaceae bacterium]
MSTGVVVLLIIALLFLGMYLYAYGTSRQEIIREEKEAKIKSEQMMQKTHQIEVEKKEIHEIRNENSGLAETRSNIIKKEIARLKANKSKQKI